MLLKREALNIPDAYKDSRFNPEVDKNRLQNKNNTMYADYEQQPMKLLVHFRLLIKLTAYLPKMMKTYFIAIGGSASIALENAQLFDQQLQMYREQKLMFESFIDTLATSIDARDKNYSRSFNPCQNVFIFAG